MAKTAKSKHGIPNYIPLIALAITVLIAGTGSYQAYLMPKDEIVMSILSIALLLSGYAYYKNFQFVERKALIGFLIFNIFFIIRCSLPTEQELDIKTYSIHIISLGVYLSVYCTSMKFLFSENSITKKNLDKPIAIFSTGVLLIILFSQGWQIYNQSQSLFSRPGGFLNPNMTASIALIFMYITAKLSMPRNWRITLIALTITTCIILLTQSRSVIIVLIPFWIYILYQLNIKKHAPISLILFATVIIVITLSQTGIFELLNSIATRYTGDQSSLYRMSLLQQGWAAFTESPIFGNGYRYLEHATSHSSHNEILEVLVNFGIFGFIIICIACYFLYTPLTIPLCIVCIFPTLLFSHNFFDTYAFQAALGLALAVDQSTSNKYIHKPNQN